VKQKHKMVPDRGTIIIKLAVKLMEAGKARGWSDALKQASEQVKQ
jgi:hypothetical protein